MSFVWPFYEALYKQVLIKNVYTLRLVKFGQLRIHLVDKSRTNSVLHAVATSAQINITAVFTEEAVIKIKIIVTSS